MNSMAEVPPNQDDRNATSKPTAAAVLPPTRTVELISTSDTPVDSEKSHPKSVSINTGPPRTTTSFKPWRSGDPYYHDIPKDGSPWGNVFRLVQNFDDEMSRAWREEVDTLLVFAGLFSAAVTAFTVESYRWLQEDPAETSTRLLFQISSQLSELISVSTLNRTMTTAPLLAPTTPSFTSTPSAIRVNVLWFTSLTLALTAVLIGILCKQWLREYQRYEGLSAKDAFPVRQLRYEGLVAWHVPTILSALPLLLQVSLVLFFAGLLDLLWSLNRVVASVVTTVVGLAMLVLAVTTILPCLQHLAHFSTLRPSDEPNPQCAYKSPQSWAFHIFGTWLASVYAHIQGAILGGTAVDFLQPPSWPPDRNWVQFDLGWQSHGKYIERGIRWVDQTFSRNVEAVYHIYGCLESLANDDAALCVSRIIEETWDPLVPLVGLLLPAFQHPEVHDEPEKSMTMDLILTSYLVIHHRSDTNLANRCVEQCVRLINTATDEIETTKIALEVLNIVLPRARPSDELHEQLRAALKLLFAHDLITNSNIDSFFSIHSVLQNISNSDQSLTSAFTLLEDIDIWLRRYMVSGDVSIEDRRACLVSCVMGMTNSYWSLRAHAQVDGAKGAMGYDAVVGFVRCLDEFIGAPLEPLSSEYLSPWLEAAWEETKGELLPV